MATHDYVIDNSTGANVRTDINNVLQAILSNNSSSSAPSTTAAYMWWADTSNGILKIRNSANSAWVELLQLDGTLTLEDGAVTTPALAFRDDLNTGIYSSAANTFNIATAGVERMELASTGTIFNEDGEDVDFRIEGNNDTNLFYVDAGNDRIGIGINTPINNLHLHQNDSGKSILQFTNTTTGTGATDGLHVGHVADEDVAFWNHEDTDINIATNNTHRIKIKNDGLVGVNLGSGVDPLELVHMKGNLYIAKNASGANEGNAIKFQTKTGGFSTSYGAAIHGLRVGDTSSYLRFDTGGQSEKMRLDENGRLGIGTSNPSEKLDVSGSAAIDGDLAVNSGSIHITTDGQRLRLGAGSGGSGDLELYHDGSNSYIEDKGTGELRIRGAEVVRIQDPDSAEDMAVFNKNGSVELYYDNSKKLETASDKILFHAHAKVNANATYDLGASGARWNDLYIANNIYLKDDGEVRLGDSGGLQIYHSGSQSYIVEAGTGRLNIVTNEFRLLNSANNEIMINADENGAVQLRHDNSIKLETTSSGVTVTGTVTETSDIALKSDIQPLTNTLEKIQQITGYKYNLLNSISPSMGVIAQDVEKVFPELVHGSEGNKTLQYSGLIGVLVEAVKDLSAKVAALEAA